MNAITKREVLGTVTVNGGRDRGELVREADPETGLTVEHLYVLTATYVDRLYADGLLSHDARQGADMRDAANRLHGDWLASGVAVGHVQGRDMERSNGGGGRPADISVRDEDAYRRYTTALGALTPMDANIARRAIISEQPVMLGPLRSALSGLVQHYTRGRARG